MRGWGRAVLGALWRGARSGTGAVALGCGGRAMGTPARRGAQPNPTETGETPRTGTGDRRWDEVWDAAGPVGPGATLGLSAPPAQPFQNIGQCRKSLIQGYLQS